MTNLIDSYSESNFNHEDGISAAAFFNDAVSQSFNCNTDGNVLDSCVFYLRKYGTPTGTYWAELYSHSGTYGTSSVPNALLATSGTLDIATTLTTSYQLITFNFSGAQRVALTGSNTKYCIVVRTASGDISNYIAIGVNRFGAPGHGGNIAGYVSSWSANPYEDVCFYVYGASAVNNYTKSLTEVIVVDSAIFKKMSKPLACVISIVPSIFRKIGKDLSEVVSMDDAIKKAEARRLGEVVVMADSIGKKTSRLFSETISIVEAAIETAYIFTKELVETIIISPLASLKIVAKILMETIVIVEATVGMMRSIFISLAEVIIIDPAIAFSKVFTGVFQETVLIVQTVTKKTSRLLVEAITVSVSILNKAIHSKAFTENIVIVPATSFMKSLHKVLVERLILRDTFAHLRTAYKSLTESLVISAALSIFTRPVDWLLGLRKPAAIVGRKLDKMLGLNKDTGVTVGRPQTFEPGLDKDTNTKVGKKR